MANKFYLNRREQWLSQVLLKHKMKTQDENDLAILHKIKTTEHFFLFSEQERRWWLIKFLLRQNEDQRGQKVVGRHREIGGLALVEDRREASIETFKLRPRGRGLHDSGQLFPGARDDRLKARPDSEARRIQLRAGREPDESKKDWFNLIVVSLKEIVLL
jgi:hypothetical protein